ncbi:MAG TPA: hypothetical protein VF230_03880 [Acidimicrobiales bacterium]
MEDRKLQDTSSDQERWNDQQFGAAAARDQERAEEGTLDNERTAERPRAGNKEEDLSDNREGRG